jgi:hypothetical protein
MVELYLARDHFVGSRDDPWNGAGILYVAIPKNRSTHGWARSDSSATVEDGFSVAVPDCIEYFYAGAGDAVDVKGEVARF